MTLLDGLQAAAVAFLEVGVFAAVVACFDRLAPSTWVMSRHNFALAGLWLLPIVFCVALQPTSTPLFEPSTSHLVAPDSPIDTVPPTPTTIAPAAQPEIRRAFVRDAGAVATYAVLTIWALVGMALGVRLGRDALQLRAVWRRLHSEPLQIALSVPLTVLRSPDVRTPILIGYSFRTIAVPEDFLLDCDARLLLEHEVAHAVRRDDWSELINRTILVLFWWAVPAYYLNRIVRRNREILCDMQAAEVTGAPRELALALVTAAARTVRAPALSLPAYSSRALLSKRIQHLVDASRSPKRSKGTLMRMSITLPLLALGVFVGTPKVVAQSQRQPSVTSAPTSPVRAIDRAAFRASTDGDLELLETLLAQGANINARLFGDGTALIAAARNGDLRLIERLLAAGADPNLGVLRDGTPLIAASARGHDDVVRRLIQAGAAIDAGIRLDGNPLIAAAQRGRTKTVELLLSLGANPNAFVYGDETPLINAAQAGHLAVAEILLKAGSNPSLTVKTPHSSESDQYRSPLSEAQRNGHERIVTLLRAWGAQHRPAR